MLSEQPLRQMNDSIGQTYRESNQGGTARISSLTVDTKTVRDFLFPIGSFRNTVTEIERRTTMLEKVKEFLHQDWTMTEKILLIADLLLAGVLIGWLTAPFKGGLFSNNVFGSNNENFYDEADLEDEEE